VASKAIPESKEQENGKLVLYTTPGEEFKSPHLQTMYRKLKDKGASNNLTSIMSLSTFCIWKFTAKAPAFAAKPLK